MVTKDVIKEIYKKYSRIPKNTDELRIPYFVQLLSNNHSIQVNDGEIIIDNLEDFNPFKRFLIRRLTGILELDRLVAFVFDNHIIFFEKNDKEMHVHFKPEKKSFWGKLLGK